MKIIIDNRERDLYEKCVGLCQNQPNIIISSEVLNIGDILIKTNDDSNMLLIERKSFSDLLSSIKDGRYEEQSYRLFNTDEFPLHSIVYLLEGMFSQLKQNSDKKIIYSAMTSLHMFKGFSVYRTSNIGETAEWIISIAEKLERDLSKGKIPYYLTQQYLKKSTQNANISRTHETPILDNGMLANELAPIIDSCTIISDIPNYCTVVKKVKKDNVTPENIGEIILCQIPGISSVTAIAIMKRFKNFPTLMDELKQNPNILENLTYDSNGKSRKISKTCIESIRQFLLA